VGKHAKQNLSGVDFSELSLADSVELLRDILADKIYGISFSPYLDGQEPGIELGQEQIEQRMRIIQPCVRLVRSFSCLEGHQHIPRIARRHGLNTMVGVCLSEDHDKNELELASGIELAKEGVVDILAVGNEVLLRQELTVDEIIGYIDRARQEVPGVQISYVDAYYLFEQYPALVQACDLLLINCYPFWEECPAEYSLLYMKDMYRRAVNVANGKKVVISETGWPSAGENYGAAIPSLENEMKYFINTYKWAEQDDVEIVYFSSFDESWKTGDEGDVGAYWGLWDKDNRFKFDDIG